MSTMGEEVDLFLDEYKKADKATRNRKRGASLSEYYKWKAIREGMREIDFEGADKCLIL